MIIYRADTRTPEIIKTVGFQARTPMTLPAARSLLLSYCENRKSPLDLSRLIISSPQPQYISTDPDEDCGGYSHKGYIYKIEFELLGKKEWSDSVLGKQLKLKPNMLWPLLYLNADKLAMATTIALKHFGATKEVTFLTAIPGSNVRAYKKSGDKIFTKM
jgi:hypothetical protein